MFSKHDEQGRTLAPVRATSKPYKIKGVWYYPQPHYELEEEGIASFYGGGDIFHGRPTATGERFDMNGMTAAHKTLPLPCMVEVTNLENGKQLHVKVNDRGPFIKGRIIDMSRRGAQLLGFERQGTAKVRIRTLVPETLAMNNLPGGETLFGPSENVTLADAPPAPAAPASPLEFETPAVMELPALDDGPFVHATLPPAPTSPPMPMDSSGIMSGIFVDAGPVGSLAEGQRVAGTLGQITDTSLIQGPDGIYTVRMGPLSSLSDADKLVDHLVSVGHDAPRIVCNR